jgi:ribonuclease-3
VGQRHLLRVAEQLQIGHYMRLGRGEEKSGGRSKASLLVDALEAILAALYLDGGWPAARDFIVRAIVEPELAHMKLETSALPVMDFKSALQETLQASGRAQPVYVLVKEEGPEHRKTFTVEARLPEAEAQFVGRAEGATKKRAEQEAARQVLEHLSRLPEGRASSGEKSAS